ncbi:BgTH12-02873 [Blumeria graminis f. sp. triticale]|uniref:Protein farnesyltransferase/geranylgeranyltransferase type-1 subunit alpha n=1 Tax=Blumeria graminis f. sp. triticale TaxID=1689686 RepID=A0A9W4D8D9_BLUGR|nr:BgTH12-02873 [Blumeria graminis f. sp. triticale]
MGYYESNPEWDDVIPIAQFDGEGALAAIAYTEEYSEAMSYLRAVIASKEYSIRALNLTAHVISLNPAHYTVWLYRASTIFRLKASVASELDWLSNIALTNQKNYQIWHHRQLLIDHLFPTIAKDLSAIQKLAQSETEFMEQMFDEDSKNYHVWSYRQYLVQKLNLFNHAELSSIEALLEKDIRNNSAWSHRFFLVFSNPEYANLRLAATEHDPLIPISIIDREIKFAKEATYQAPQNQSPWNYLRGVLRKGDRSIISEEEWATRFVNISKDETATYTFVASSHALEFLADIWSEKGEFGKADKALTLLGEKYDPIRKNYWEWKRLGLSTNLK